MRLRPALSGAFFIACALAHGANADVITHDLTTSATSPLPSGSCLYVDQGPGIDAKLCSGWAVALGAVPLNGAGGTPSSITLTNGTGLPIAGIAGLGTGFATFATTPSSANFFAMITDETGSGPVVGANSPTLVTPNLGTPSAITLTNGTGLPVAGITGLASGIPTWLATPSSANLAAALTTKTGSGNAVFGTGPTISGLVVSGITSSVLKTDASSIISAAANGTDYTKVVTTTCSGTDKVSAITASGAVTCSADVSGGGGSSQTVTDGTTSVVASTETMGVGLRVTDLGSGNAQVDLTNVSTDKSASGQAIVTGDAGKTVLVGAFSYTLAQAGTTGFGTGWGACLLNVGAANATVTATTSTFNGAGGTTSLTIPPRGWACPQSDGTNYPTIAATLDSVPGALFLTGANTPTTLSGNVNDYNPTGLSTASKLRIGGGTSDRTITGIAGGSDGRILTIVNIGTTNSLVFSNADTGSSAANRFDMDASTSVPPSGAITFEYDGTSSRWRPFGRTHQTVDYVVGWGSATSPNKFIAFRAPRSMVVTGIVGTVGDAVGAAATMTVRKVASGTACASGTALHTGTFNANGTAATDQTLTLSSTVSDLQLSSGDRVCLDVDSTSATNMAAGTGTGAITVSARAR